MHKLKKIVVAMSLIAPVSAYPLGVGELKLNSALNESLNAEISLALSANENINDISITIASPEKFDQAGISWHYFLSGIQFNKVSKGNNNYVVELTSNNIVQEPFLDFLLEVKWPNGKIFKSFTVLVDPVIGHQNDFIEPVQTPLKKQKKPVAQVKKELDSIESNFSRLAVEGEYGPTQRNDSLWKIAEKINHNGASVEQVMMALYRANPRAFYKKNVNALMAGKTLKIPSDADVDSLSKEDAKTEFYYQNDVWSGKRKAKSNTRSVITQKKKDKQLILVSPVKEELKESENLIANTGKQKKIIHKNEELLERLALLEEKFSVMQRMLVIKDKELAALQNSQFSAKLDALEEKQKKSAKEKIQTKKEAKKPETTVKEKVLAPVKVVTKPKKLQPTTVVEEEAGIGYLNVILGLLALLLVAVGGFFSWRKRQTESDGETENIFKATDHQSLSDSTESNDEAAIAISNETSFAVKLAEYPKIKEEKMDDVLLDADTYLAYGKYDEAEKALRQELKISPKKDSYKLKLLEVFYSSENNEAFDSFVEELIKEGKRSDKAFWGNVSVMGQDFSSHSELFSDDIIKDDSPEFDLNIDEAIEADVEEVLEVPVAELNIATEASEVDITEFEFDNGNSIKEKAPLEPEKLDIESFEFTLNSDDKIAERDSIAQTTDDSEALEMIDFSIDKKSTEAEQRISIAEPEDLDLIDMDLSGANSPADEASVDINSDKSEDLLLSSESDIDLSEFSLSDEAELTDELNIDSHSVAETPESGTQDSLANDDQFDDFDFDFSVEGDASYSPSTAVDENELTLGDDDQKLTLDSNMISEINDTGDYETNLDLAKMYVAMGETDAAKELAEDVLVNGSDEQKKEAQEVLDHISS